MSLDRRQFLGSMTALGGAAVAGATSLGATAVQASRPASTPQRPKGAPASRMKLSFVPYTLELRHVFTIAISSRTTTPDVLTRIEYEGLTGYGEASMPPYLGESIESASAFLSKVDLSRFPDPFRLEEILAYVDEVAPGNPAAKASIDIALHDLVGKLMNQPWYRIWGLDPTRAPYTTFTIGIDTPEVVKEKTREAAEYKILKVKLGRDTDKEIIQAIRSVTNVPLSADANQGWKDRQQALDMLHWLKDQNVQFVEQPMAKEDPDGNAWITERSPIPIIGDEAVQRLSDIKKASGIYSGINVKLMKSTGMREGWRMITTARALGMKVLLGCMTETSCGISAASHLSPLVDWADLDGALLIKNDPFEGTRVVDGKVTLSDAPGIGLTKIGWPGSVSQ